MSQSSTNHVEVTESYGNQPRVRITWTPASGPLAGKTLTGGEYEPKGCGPVKGEPVVFFRKPAGMKDNVIAKVAGKPDLQALVDQIPGLLADLAVKKRAAEVAVETGEIPITVYYHDGEYLSGYSLQGYAATLLVKLGLAKDVNGWGCHVERRLVDALGETFTYPQAVEFIRPAGTGSR